MGGTTSTTEQNITNTAVADIINKSVLKNTQNCQNTLSLSQDIKLNCNPSDAVLQLIIQGKTQCALAGKPKDVCDSIVACNLSNIKQTQTASFTGGCKVDNSQISKIQSDVSAEMQSKMSQSNDVLGKAFEKLLGGVAGGSSDTNKMNIKNSITQKITNEVNQEFVQNLINQFAANQNVNITGAGLNVNGITQDLQLQIVINAMSSNQNIQSAVATLTGSQSAESSLTNKTLFSDLFNAIQGIVGGATQAYMVISVVGLVVLLGFGYLAYSFLGGEGGITATADAVTKMADSEGVQSLAAKAMVGGGLGTSDINFWLFIAIGVAFVGLCYCSYTGPKFEGFYSQKNEYDDLPFPASMDDIDYVNLDIDPMYASNCLYNSNRVLGLPQHLITNIPWDQEPNYTQGTFPYSHDLLWHHPNSVYDL